MASAEAKQHTSAIQRPQGADKDRGEREKEEPSASHAFESQLFYIYVFSVLLHSCNTNLVCAGAAIFNNTGQWSKRKQAWLSWSVTGALLLCVGTCLLWSAVCGPQEHSWAKQHPSSRCRCCPFPHLPFRPHTPVPGCSLAEQHQPSFLSPRDTPVQPQTNWSVLCAARLPAGYM